MTDFGYLTATTTCPSCGTETDVRIFGENGDTKYKSVTCDCGVTFTSAVVITVSGAVTDYTLS